MKKVLAVLLVLAMAMSMVACGTSTAPSETSTPAKDNPATSAQTDVGNAAAGKKAAMITAQPLGDQGVTDDTYSGFIKGCEEFGYEPTVVEVQAGEYEETLRSLCQEGYDIIMPCWSALEDACARVSAEYPDSEFIMVFSELNLPNVKAMIGRQSQGSYLAGIDAAMTTKTGHFAFMGGSDNPSINQFRAGFEAGARSVNPDIKIEATWVGSFDDPAKGKELALVQYNAGADVVFQLASNAGVGVFEAAKETGKLAIGSDTDQSLIFAESDPDKAAAILTSSLKRVDTSLLRAYELYKQGQVPYGTCEKLGLDKECVGIVENDYFKAHVSEEDAAAIAQAKQDIIDGKITVSSSYGMTTEELAAFKDQYIK